MRLRLVSINSMKLIYLWRRARPIEFRLMSADVEWPNDQTILLSVDQVVDGHREIVEVRREVVVEQGMVGRSNNDEYD